MMALLCKIPKWVWVCVIVLGLPIIGWNVVYPTQTLRYKVTVNIETPEGIKSGSAVRQVTMRPQPLLPQGGAIFDVIGEAVVVDLGTRGTLFAVMGTDDHWMFFEAFAPPPPSGAGIAITKNGMKYYKSIKEKKVLDPKLWPLMVAFKNINDPKTVTVAYKVIRAEVREDTGLKIKAVGAEDHMAALFGEGIKITDIEIERTREKMSWRIAKTLPWLKGYPEHPIIKNIDQYDFSTEAKLREGNFIQGDSK